jgi:sorting nexin-1/2
VPAIPEKQFIGDKDEQFVEERRQLLERFICELSKYNYLVESREFQIFARGEGEQTSNFETLVKETPSAILVKYRNNFPKINENTTELPQYTEKINIF